MPDNPTPPVASAGQRREIHAYIRHSLNAVNYWFAFFNAASFLAMAALAANDKISAPTYCAVAGMFMLFTFLGIGAVVVAGCFLHKLFRLSAIKADKELLPSVAYPVTLVLMGCALVVLFISWIALGCAKYLFA